MRLAVLILVLAVAADASAAAVTLTTGPLVAGEPALVRAAVQVEEQGTWLSIYQRPASTPACDPDGARDAAAVGHDEGYVGGANGLESGTYEFTYRWPAAGGYRLCAWVFRGGGATVAAHALDVTVAAPPATLELALRGEAAGPGGFDLRAHVTGSARGQHELHALAVRGGCPAAFDPAAGRRLRGPNSVDGAFDVTLTARGLAFGRWRVCAYLDGASVARAEATLRKRLRPVALRPPAIGVTGGGLRCFPGVWSAWPRPIGYRFEWRRDGRTIATGPRLGSPAGAGPVRCRVIATNAAGSRSATSLPVWP